MPLSKKTAQQVPFQLTVLSQVKTGKKQGWEFAHLLFILLLKIAHFKEWPWVIHTTLYKRATYVNCSRCVLKKSDAKNEWIARHFFVCFWQFYPLFCLRVNHSRRSLLICSFLKSDMRDLLSSLFTKEEPWAICSGPSWPKSYGSDFPICSFSSVFPSFANKKCVNCSKNRWVNTQPWEKEKIYNFNLGNKKINKIWLNYANYGNYCSIFGLHIFYW